MKLKWDLWFRAAKWIGTGLTAMALAWTACAQSIGTTTVHGTVYLANGTPGSGSLQLSWPGFTTGDNHAVPAGRTTVTIGQDGIISMNLAPNLGSTPSGLYYTAVYHMSDGTTSTEYWVVPPGDQVSIAQVRAQVMPAVQAVQSVSRAYVDQAIRSINQGTLMSTGGTMTGPLLLSADPTVSNQAATKQYVDAHGLPAGVTSDSANGLAVAGKVAAANVTANVNNVINVMAPPYNAKCDWNGSAGTDDTAAFNAAWAALQARAVGSSQIGGELDIPAGQCYLPNGLNISTATNIFSATWLIKGQGQTSSSIVTKNANVSLDAGGLNNLHLKDLIIQDVGTTAKVGIARYRTASQGGGTHNYENVFIIGAYSLAALYSVASEVNTHYNLQIIQTGAGAGISIDYNNCLGLTGQGQPFTGAASNTVNHFHGGSVLVYSSNTNAGGVLFCSGSADNVSFDGTYLYAPVTAYNVRFGLGTGGSEQGTKTFHSVRFEGAADAISFNDGEADSLTIDGGTVFGEVYPGIDLNWIYTGTILAGLSQADIHGNSHVGRGLILPTISRSHISVGTVYNASSSYPATNINISTSVSESTVEADSFTMGSSASVNGSILIQNDDQLNTGGLKMLYGPNSPTSSYNWAGSTVAFQPFGAAPASPVEGTLAIADGQHWQPGGIVKRNLMAYLNGAWTQAVTSAIGDFPVAGNLPVGGNISNSAGGLGLYQNLFPCSTFLGGCAATNWPICGGCTGRPTVTSGFANDLYGNPTVAKMVFTTAGGISTYPFPTIPTGIPITISVYAYGAVGGEALVLGFGGGTGTQSCSLTTSVTTVNKRYSVTCTLTGSPTQQAYIQSTAGSTIFISFPQLEYSSSVGPPLYIPGTSTVSATLGEVLDGTPIVPANLALVSQLPASLSAVSHKWLNSYNAGTGLFTQTQPASADLSDLGSANGAAQLNGTGQLPIAALGSGTAASGKYVDGGTGAWTPLPLPTLTGTTASIGGSALTAGTCASGTVTVTGATTGMAVVVTPATYPGDACTWHGYVSAANTITVKVCTNLASGGTPTASVYNVRVIQ
jgi:hypothetical protein